MAAFYKPGEHKRRPGVYIRIVNRGTDAAGVMATIPVQPTPPPTPPAETDGITVAYANGIVTLSIPDCTVAYDGNGTVTLSGLASVEYDDNGIVTIGG